jgi:hypothetical protein
MDDLKLLKLELEKIKNYKAPKGFEVITSSNKRMFSYHISQLIGRIEIRNYHRSKINDNPIVGVMMDQLFDTGLILGQHYRLATEQLINFDNLMEISIDLIKRYDLIQCDTPASPDGKKRLENNISSAYSKSYKFDIYDAYMMGAYKNNIHSFMKNSKYIFNILPYSRVDINDFAIKENRGFIIQCA